MAGTSKTETTQTVPDFASMSPEDLAAFIAKANEVRAEREVAELAERRKAAMSGLKESLVQISNFVKTAGEEGIEKGSFPDVIQALSDVIATAQAARKTAAEASRAAGVKVAKTGNGGNGTQRSSDLRDEILAVVNSAPEVEWTATMIQKEVSNSPTTGNPRSTGLLGNHLDSMAGHNQITQCSDSPKKYRANAPAPDAE